MVRAPQRRPRRIEAHQWGAFPSHTRKIGSHLRFMNPPNLYSSKIAGTISMTSRIGTTPHDVEPQPYSLTAFWLGLGHKGSATWEDIESCARFRNPDKPGTITDLSRGSTQPRMMVRQSSVHIGLSLIGCAARRARDSRGGNRPANGRGAFRRTR